MTVGFRVNARTDEENAVAEERGAQRSRGFDLPVVKKTRRHTNCPYVDKKRRKSCLGASRETLACTAASSGSAHASRIAATQTSMRSNACDGSGTMTRRRSLSTRGAPSLSLSFSPPVRVSRTAVSFFVVLGGGGERREDGVGAPAPAVFGAEHAARDEDDVGVVRYEQEPQEDQLVVQIALRAVGSRAAVRGDEK